MTIKLCHCHENALKLLPIVVKQKLNIPKKAFITDLFKNFQYFFNELSRDQTTIPEIYLFI